jgi:hypothetical protein
MNMAPVHGPNRLKAKPTALVREPEVKVKRAGIPLAGVALTAGRRGPRTPLPLFAGEVGERSETGDGGATAPPSPASQMLRDLSREERERCTRPAVTPDRSAACGSGG